MCWTRGGGVRLKIPRGGAAHFSYSTVWLRGLDSTLSQYSAGSTDLTVVRIIWLMDSPYSQLNLKRRVAVSCDINKTIAVVSTNANVNQADSLFKCL